MGKKMQDAPVYFAIVQVRFNAILALDNYLSQIQEIFRKQGFGDFKKIVTATAALNVEAPEPTVSMQQRTRYLFADRDGTSAFDLDTSAFSFRTTKYDVYEKFSESFFNGLKPIHDIIGFDFYDRIGIRYLNAVYPSGKKKLSDYLNPAVQSLADHMPGQLIHGFSETAMNINGISLVSRTMIREGGVAFPPDISEMPLDNKFQNLSGRHALIDTDASIQLRQDFDVSKILEQVGKVKKESENAFKLTVTESALKEWA